MSERMVEIQRAKLGLPPPTSTASAQATPVSRQPSSSGVLPPGLPRQSSQQLAASTLNNEDQKLQKFLRRLQQQRDGGSTVPTSLARRVLHHQGVGYLDETVAMLTAAAADRFLATVLQQGIVCRDRRVAGQELNKEELARRRKHISLYQQDSEYRKRRKLERTSQKVQAHVAAVAVAKDLSQRGNSVENKANASKKKPLKKGESMEDEPNGTKTVEETIDDSEYLEDDSLDDEERYYNDFYGECPEGDDEEDAEEDLTLLLRDLERPLEAWNFKLTGKVGLGAIPIEAAEPISETIAGGNDAKDDEENDEETDDIDEPELGENGESRSRTPKPSPSKGSKMSENGPDSTTVSRAATPMASLSPAPK